jgi:hypothetical protein
MSAWTETVALWRNPIFARYCRSRLRLKSAVFWYLLAVIVTTFVVTLGYVLMINAATPPQTAARRLWIPLLIIQGAILMIKGTGAVAAGLIQDKIDQTLDYQRLTPLSPLQCLLGYLYGLPVLELVMFALTLPHLAFIVVIGNIPLSALVGVYFAFFVCVTLYHMTAIAVGIVMNRWILGYLLSIFTVLLINMILPTFVSQLGLKFVQFLSVWPVIGQKVLPIVVSPDALDVAARNPYFSMAADVPVYDWLVTPLVFTTLLQGSLILTFFLMAYRRWRSAAQHSLSKPYAMVFLAGFIVLVIGNVWPAVTGRYLPFQIFGQNDLSQLTEVIAIAFPLIFSLISWLLTGVLLAVVVPGHHACVRGLRRAARQGRTSPAPWDDDSANIAFLALFVVIVMIGFYILYSQLAAAGFFDFRVDARFGLWRLPTALALVLLYTLMLLQVLELRPATLVVLLLWFVPLLVSAVLSAAAQEATMLQAVIASVSPIGVLVMAGAVPLIGFVPEDPGLGVDLVVTGCHAGLVFVSLQIVFLAVRWRMLMRAFRLSVERNAMLA